MKLRRDDKFKRIIKFIVQHYNTINSSTMIEIQNNIHEIYDILIKNRLPRTCVGYLYKGMKCQIDKKYKNMLKYYLLAIDLNDDCAMNLLGYYYQYVEVNYDLMKKYYGMAINLNNKSAMNNLGYYYQYVEVNYDLMKKYYDMAINLNNKSAMNNLGYYYQYVEVNYDLMKKYYDMAINLNNKSAMNNLGVYC